MISQQLRDAKQLASARFLRRTPGVVAVGIGNKEFDGRDTGVPCVRIYVSRIFVNDELPINCLIPKKILGVLTDVVPLSPPAFNPLSAFAVETDAPNVNPILTGVFGAVVNYGGNRYILGTNHTLASNGRVPAGSPIFLPYSDRIGTTLAGRFVKLHHGEQNRADCALAQLDVALDAFTIDSADKVHEPQLGQIVQKSGVEQAGTIVDISADLFVDYSFGTFLLVDQVFVKGNNGAFARQGDSGAIVVDNSTDRAVAMVFATAGKFTAVCPLQRALELLGVWPPNGNLSAT